MSEPALEPILRWLEIAPGQQLLQLKWRGRWVTVPTVKRGGTIEEDNRDDRS